MYLHVPVYKYNIVSQMYVFVSVSLKAVLKLRYSARVCNVKIILCVGDEPEQCCVYHLG